MFSRDKVMVLASQEGVVDRYESECMKCCPTEVVEGVNAEVVGGV